MKMLSLVIATLLLAGCSRGPESCQVCQRVECKGIAFRVTTVAGKIVETCCPRCGLHHLNSTGQQARSLAATDLSAGQWVDATKAVYVSGSDVSPCASMETKRDAYGCCAVKGFDRCMPSLIAFATREAAVAFQKQHGGEVLPWEQIQSTKPTQ